MIFLLLGQIKARYLVKDIKVLNVSICFHYFYESALFSAYTAMVIVKGEEKFNFNHSDYCYVSSALLWQQISALSLITHQPVWPFSVRVSIVTVQTPLFRCLFPSVRNSLMCTNLLLHSRGYCFLLL